MCQALNAAPWKGPALSDDGHALVKGEKGVRVTPAFWAEAEEVDEDIEKQIRKVKVNKEPG